MPAAADRVAGWLRGCRSRGGARRRLAARRPACRSVQRAALAGRPSCPLRGRRAGRRRSRLSAGRPGARPGLAGSPAGADRRRALLCGDRLAGQPALPRRRTAVDPAGLFPAGGTRRARRRRGGHQPAAGRRARAAGRAVGRSPGHRPRPRAGCRRCRRCFFGHRGGDRRPGPGGHLGHLDSPPGRRPGRAGLDGAGPLARLALGHHRREHRLVPDHAPVSPAGGRRLGRRFRAHRARAGRRFAAGDRGGGGP